MEWYVLFLCFPVPLGSIPELPAETCKEIKLSEGGQAVNGNYWFYSIIPGETVLAHCDMKKEGMWYYEDNFFFIFVSDIKKSFTVSIFAIDKYPAML